MPSRRSVLVGAAALSGAAQTGSVGAYAAGRGLLVAAATDLQVVLPKLEEAFRRSGGVSLTISYGATGNLARQIRQRAPFEIFLAADESFIDGLANDGVVAERGEVYARGRLALVVGRETAFATAPSLDALAVAARGGQAFRLAIANPEHAPYGRRAKEALVSQGVADALEPRLVYGETVAQALQFVATRAAAAGLVGSSLVAGPAGETVVSVTLPASWHSPIVQRLVVTGRGKGDDARKFAAFMTSPEARAILLAHGFDPPA
jgi:molybdate transport system substrate-binding protein